MFYFDKKEAPLNFFDATVVNILNEVVNKTISSGTVDLCIELKAFIEDKKMINKCALE
jgi:hypothetical protein